MGSETELVAEPCTIEKPYECGETDVRDGNGDSLASGERTASQDLSNMDDSNRFFLPADDPVKVHQATHVGRGNELGFGIEMIGNSIAPHHRRDVRLIDRKGSAEATAFVTSRRSPHHSISLGPDSSRERTLSTRGTIVSLDGTKPQFAQPVAALVQRDTMGKTDIEVIDLEVHHAGTRRARSSVRQHGRTAGSCGSKNSP